MLLVASLLNGNYHLAGKMMKKTYIISLIDGNLFRIWPLLKNMLLYYGAFGVALSGAGPTILSLVEPGKRQM